MTDKDPNVKLIKIRRLIQKKLTIRLCNNAGVPLGECRLNEI